jgi:hypothetical protein
LAFLISGSLKVSADQRDIAKGRGDGDIKDEEEHRDVGAGAAATTVGTRGRALPKGRTNAMEGEGG